MDRDFNNNFIPPFMDYGVPPNGNADDIFNPMVQYEQGYCYYRYLCMQMDYKIKCKEYEKLCASDLKNSPYGREKKIE